MACALFAWTLDSEGRDVAMTKVRVAPDGRSFATQDRKPFVPFGVNYYRPGTGWAPQLWKKFDAEATREDFARMKRLGVNCVRVFLSYGSFYTQPGVLEAEGLEKFDQFLQIAEGAEIYVHPTGPDHWEGTPDWARADRIADEKVLSALETFWRLFAARYRGHNVIFAYDLRNEPEVAWDDPVMRRRWNEWLLQRYGSAAEVAKAWGVSLGSIRWNEEAVPEPKDAPRDKRLLDYQHFRQDVADEWTRRQASAIKSVDPEALVTVGLIQWSVPSLLPGVRSYSGFRPDRQAKFLDFLEVHFYPLDKGFYEYRGAEDEERNLAYLESVVGEVAKPGKPVVLAEFGWYGGGKSSVDGGKHPAASEEQQARWCRRVIETTRGLAVGWLNWGLYDQPEATDVSQLTGLLTAGGKTKVWGDQFSKSAKRFRQKKIPACNIEARPALDWDLCITTPSAGTRYRDAYFHAWKAAQ
jgi:Cellulase (glycosyl hydrolase family 5)